MMKSIYKTIHKQFFLFTLLLLPVCTQAQITFEKSYTGSYDMDGLDVTPTTDGGYMIAGFITNDIIDDMDVYIVKTNNIGDILWTKTYGGDSPDFSYSILPTLDGNYFVLGYTQSFGGGDYDTWLLKLDNSGDTLWTKRYGSWGNDQGKEIISTSDGNYVITGYSNSATYPDYQAYLIKINPSGDIIWEKYYGGTNIELGNSVKQCPDGGYVMFGQTFSYGAGGGDAYMVKTNTTGDALWYKTFGGAQNDEGICIVSNSDTTFALCIRDSSSVGKDIDVQIIKTDANGDIIWDKKYGGTEKDTDKMIQATSDGGYIVAAISRSFGWNLPDMWILKLNSSGDTLWTRNYGGNDNEHCYAVRETADGGYIAVGKTESYSSTNGIMFLKLNSLGKLGTAVGFNDIYSDNTLNVYPNPSEGFINIDFSKTDSPLTLKITNALGQIVFFKKFNLANANEISTIDLKDNEPGIYLLTTQSNSAISTTKLVRK